MITGSDTRRSVPYGVGSSPRPPSGAVDTSLTSRSGPGRRRSRSRPPRAAGEAVEERVHLRHPVAAEGQREADPAHVLGRAAARRRAPARRGGRRTPPPCGAPRPAATAATPPMTSTTRIAKNHIMGAHRRDRAWSISSTASSTSSVSTSMSRSAWLILPSASAMSRSQSSRPGPVLTADQHDRERGDLLGLDQRQRLEQLVEGAEAAGEHHEALGVLHEHRLAGEEVAEVDPDVDPLVQARTRRAARCRARR